METPDEVLAHGLVASVDALVAHGGECQFLDSVAFGLRDYGGDYGDSALYRLWHRRGAPTCRMARIDYGENSNSAAERSLRPIASAHLGSDWHTISEQN
jgi:hypothetical protein